MFVSMNSLSYLKQYCEKTLNVKQHEQEKHPTPERSGEISQLKQILNEIHRAEQIQHYTLS